MAASLTLTQLSSGNPVYEKYYRQVDPSGSGRVPATDAALFLKRSGLADLVLGKIWDLSDSERKGSLNKQQFFVALQLVACAQNGLEVSLKSLHVAVPPPKFHDTSSPLLHGGVSTDVPWVVKSEEKLKFDSIFDSLSPVGGMLSGEKVKPVLLNSKLPVDILGRVWELSDIDRDGMLDRDEFAVAMYLVYRALEQEPVPMSLPPPLVPPSKRKKPPVTAPVLPLLPSPPSLKESRSSHAGSKTLPPTKPATPQWVVSPADKTKYDELFIKTDTDMDGLVSGPEVREIFLKTGLPSATLAHIWELCDIGDIGKLTRDQFSLALHLINQKLAKGIDPPQALTPDMIPPSDRTAAQQAADFSAIKELDSLSNEIADLQKEKSSVEQEIREKEENIRQRSSEVQDLQDEVQKESSELQQLQSQRQEVQEALEKLEQQKSSLEEQLGVIRQQCSQESQLIMSLQTQQVEQEQRIGEYEEELSRARLELQRLQEETQLLEQKVDEARARLSPLHQSVKESHSQVTQVQEKLSDLRMQERDVSAQLTWKSLTQDDEPVTLVNGAVGEEHLEAHPQSQDAPGEQEESSSDEPQELRVEEEELEEVPQKEKIQDVDPMEDLYSSARSGIWALNSNVSNDPFKDDPFTKGDISDPFGGDPFKGTDPFAADTFFKQSSIPALAPKDPFSLTDPFTTDTKPPEPDLFSSSAVSDPFGPKVNNMPNTDPFSTKMEHMKEADPFSSQGSAVPDPFTSTSPGTEIPTVSAFNDPFAPGGTVVSTDSDPGKTGHPFATAFGNESFGGGFADFSALAKSNGADPFGTSSKNLFKEDSQPSSPDVPPALPPKTGTPTRPPPPPPGKRTNISRSESSDSFHRRAAFLPQGSGNLSSLPAKDAAPDPFAPSSPRQHPRDPEGFASFDKYPTEEDMIEWAKRESEREEKERLARLTQQEQEDLELAIALSRSELS
uniref:Epidermal growth factor receptor pathway substrate 15 n=1 Tax=Denticeps clupeoides TaxID=299321 RepID=A0AAY4CJM6_9TELE